MRQTLALLIALCFLVVTSAAALASGDGANAGSTAQASAEKKVHCKKGYKRKHRHGKFVCVKIKKGTKPTPHPGLDVLGTPGTYKGSDGVTLTSSKTAEGSPQITLRIVFPSGYVSCDGKPPYPSVTATVRDMLVSGYGEFGGSSSSGGTYSSVHGHFTGPNTLVLETASVSNVLTHGQRCAGQYTDASVVF